MMRLVQSFGDQGKLIIKIYTDAGFTGSFIDFSSTIGDSAFLRGNLITWRIIWNVKSTARAVIILGGF